MKRRDFLKFGGVAATSTVAAAAGSVATPRAQGQDSQDKRYRVALIGTGWYGKIDLFRLMQVADVDVVALCDVDQPALEEAVKLVAERAPGKPAPQPFHDYREMLEKMDLDIVLIGTPDHWHALQMIDAVNSGADVYVQKPIGVDVKECLAMLRVARDKGAVVQVGLQRRSTPHLIQAKKEIVDSGKLGRVGQVELFSYYGGPGAAFRQQTETPPEGFDYDFWCGPAPKIP